MKCVLVVVLLLSIGSGGSRRRERMLWPTYDLFSSDEIPSDVQITTFLKKNESKSFVYHSLKENLQLSAIVTGCSSRVDWKITLNDSGSALTEKTSEGMQILGLRSQLGTYNFLLRAIDEDTYAHVYISTESDGPEALKGRENRKLLLRRQRNNRLAIKWDPSLVDPQGTEYCLVISSLKHHETFCGAGNLLKPEPENRTNAASENLPKCDVDPMIICTGKKTHYAFLKPQQNLRYYFDLFAINLQTNFTYLFASNTTMLSNKLKPASLKDGKLTFVNLKEMDGKAVFRFKVGRKSHDDLEVYVMPCGGAVDVQVTKRHEVIETRRTIEGFGKISVKNPQSGARYNIKIFSTNGEELRRTSGIELYATSRKKSFIPLPDLPNKPIVKEYVSLRSCDSVTVGWLPSPGQKTSHYCLVIKEGKLRYGFKQTNQCGLENRLKKSTDFAAKYCKDIKPIEGKVITQKIGQLKPGRSYIVQVTVKKHRGKTISYDLLQAQTKSKCDPK
ncbi:PREDICTED: protein NDNF [Nicrophorus vespilloides]|uniref:Protein NDNF n=1 Tax=Nicrophorus vespilloides TaxID=110193 RepID=A0ABM1MWC7_NICVS|nr:PREDICTED: protein NDNF [Nicrophorus vespilloides]